jgi:DNA-binding PadR family transcriptional regulator
MLPSSVAAPDASGLYRLLHGLEVEGSLRSRWASPGPGPARRVYELTDAGREALDGWASSMESEIRAVSAFLSTYYREASEHGASEAEPERPQ